MHRGLSLRRWHPTDVEQLSRYVSPREAVHFLKPRLGRAGARFLHYALVDHDDQLVAHVGAAPSDYHFDNPIWDFDVAVWSDAHRRQSIGLQLSRFSVCMVANYWPHVKGLTNTTIRTPRAANAIGERFLLRAGWVSNTALEPGVFRHRVQPVVDNQERTLPSLPLRAFDAICRRPYDAQEILMNYERRMIAHGFLLDDEATQASQYLLESAILRAANLEFAVAVFKTVRQEPTIDRLLDKIKHDDNEVFETRRALQRVSLGPFGPLFAELKRCLPTGNDVMRHMDAEFNRNFSACATKVKKGSLSQLGLAGPQWEVGFSADVREVGLPVPGQLADLVHRLDHFRRFIVPTDATCFTVQGPLHLLLAAVERQFLTPSFQLGRLVPEFLASSRFVRLAQVDYDAERTVGAALAIKPSLATSSLTSSSGWRNQLYEVRTGKPLFAGGFGWINRKTEQSFFCVATNHVFDSTHPHFGAFGHFLRFVAASNSKHELCFVPEALRDDVQHVGLEERARRSGEMGSMVEVAYSLNVDVWSFQPEQDELLDHLLLLDPENVPPSRRVIEVVGRTVLQFLESHDTDRLRPGMLQSLQYYVDVRVPLPGQTTDENRHRLSWQGFCEAFEAFFCEPPDLSVLEHVLRVYELCNWTPNAERSEAPGIVAMRLFRDSETWKGVATLLDKGNSVVMAEGLPHLDCRELQAAERFAVRGSDWVRVELEARGIGGVIRLRSGLEFAAFSRNAASQAIWPGAKLGNEKAATVHQEMAI